jgi:hypothetical protein
MYRQEISRYDAINKIIDFHHLKNPAYLEIGVWTGETFKNIKSNIKDGVDPGQYCDCKYVNYKITSDEFFKNHINKKYDIIFIDGLHTAFQVSKDIFNSINNLNDGGWIILDDVFPHSENEQERLNLNKSGSQTGDVWKALYNVLDTIIEISDIIYFINNTERGNFIFKVKQNNTKNIVIDETIPTCNIDGWYQGNGSEWNKYTYKRDFPDYIKKLNKFIPN